jgi:transcriptional regulator with XRE-family HTH domain
MNKNAFEIDITLKNDSLGDGIAKAIRGALKQRKWTVQYLAKETGVARQTLSLLLSSAKGRSWTLNHLVRVTTVLGISLAELIAAAESGEELSELMVDLAGTEPHSKERLTRIVQTLAAKGTPREVLDLYFTAEMLQISVPQYAADYYAGRVSDREVYDMLTEFNAELEPQENLWGKLSAVMTENEA